jgi:hypothetical protein
MHAWLFGFSLGKEAEEETSVEMRAYKNYKARNAFTLPLGRDEKVGASESSRR